MKLKRIPALLGAAALAWTLGAAPAASGDVLVPDEEFLARSLPLLRGTADSLAAGSLTVDGTVAKLRQVLEERHRALLEFHLTTPLTTPTGVETQDRYDTEALLVIEEVLAAGPSTEALPQDPEAVARLDEALGPMPDLGRTPLPFMVLILVDRVFEVADSLVAHGHLEGQAAGAVILRVTLASVDRWQTVRNDPFYDASAQDFRHDSVVMRLRCPKDHGIYKLNHMKNQFRESGNISRLYYLACTVCGEPMLLEFPLELVSRLNRMAERQNPAHPAAPAPSYAIEP